MQDRGVTRPMAQNHKSKDDQHGHDREHKLKMHHEKTLWIYWTLIILGFWLVISPFTFGYLNETQWVDPSGGRGAWFSDSTHTGLRAWLMTWSDIISGLALIVFGWRSLKPNRPLSLWIACGIGIWITFAPVIFWSPLSSAYLNDTIVGAFLIALTVLIPGMPNMIMYMQMGGDKPKGWSYNPSSWPQRWIMIALGFVGWVVSRYLTTYQLGYIDEVWDPFFGFANNTKQVLDSKMSHSWPISDAGLGALSYTFEFLMGWMGAPTRWRTMPWMVAFFGILVIPLGLVHIFLVISQPVVVGSWCFFCLLAAAIMLPMIPVEADEVFAMVQHMKEAKKRGDRNGSLWQVFWKGGSAEGTGQDERTPAIKEFADKPGALIKASLWGVTPTWTLSLSTAIGIGVMFLPFLLGTPEMASHIFHLSGALVITFSVIAMGELLRLLRYLNIILALVIGVGPFFINSASSITKGLALVCGVILIVLALPRGKVKEDFGEWNKYIR